MLWISLILDKQWPQKNAFDWNFDTYRKFGVQQNSGHPTELVWDFATRGNYQNCRLWNVIETSQETGEGEHEN